jgi:2-oxoglutarate dehydrogenase E2 component (dihydrolipoamide succinyltransferase)
MAIEIKAPQFPESVADGTVATWHKQPGDAVKRDELIVDIETDKVVMEVLAEADGVLSEIVKNEGDTVLSGELLGKLDAGATASAPAASAPAEAAAPAAPAASAPAAGADDAILAPAARKLAEENGIDPTASRVLVKTVASLKKTWLPLSKPRSPLRLPASLLPALLLLLSQRAVIAPRSACR